MAIAVTSFDGGILLDALLYEYNCMAASSSGKIMAHQD
jgi:hypothetical protein